MGTIWDFLLKNIKDHISEESIIWLDHVKPFELSENRILLAVPNKFLKDWIAERYKGIMERIAKENLGKDITIEIAVLEEKRKGDEKRDIQDPMSISSKIFNPKYTFDTFVVGSGNQFARAACLAVSNNPGKTYNPLFVYGGVGLGKTHLLNAIGHNVIKNGFIKDLSKICYISAEAFTNEVINSIRYGKMDSFRNKYRMIDILLIDDIQFISGKERTQEEFFHTFNALYQLGKQIVITSDKFPKDLPDIEERLKSRFQWGLIADIQPPDIETKVAILRKKAEMENIDLPDDVAFFLAKVIDSNIRTLEGALIRLGAYSQLTGSPITIELAKDLLRNMIKEEPEVITVEKIQKVVSNYFGISINDIKSEKRKKGIALPRQIAMYLAREHTKLSLGEIGEKFGGRNHATVTHSINRIKELIKKDKKVKNIVEKLSKTLTKQ